MIRFAVIRIRGTVNLNPKIKKTLEMLRLFKVNHLVLLGEEANGMLNTVQNFVTWGEVDEITLAKLLKKRARLPGNARPNKEFLKEKGFASFDELSKALIEGKTKLETIGLKPVLRLSPPKKGHKRAGIKKGYHMGGALGYRAGDINALIKKMA